MAPTVTEITLTTNHATSTENGVIPVPSSDALADRKVGFEELGEADDVDPCLRPLHVKSVGDGLRNYLPLDRSPSFTEGKTKGTNKSVWKRKAWSTRAREQVF